jgi:predicted anti-sigma-YlaC factor YlaD
MQERGRVVRLKNEGEIMDCVSEKMMLDLLGGQAAEEQRSQVMEHIRNCRQCEKVWQEMKETWEQLGRLQGERARAKLTDDIMRAIAGRGRRGRNQWTRELVRIAASIAVAIFIGYMAGKMSVQPGEEYGQGVTAEALHLEALATGSVTGWAEAIIQDDGRTEYK